MTPPLVDRELSALPAAVPQARAAIEILKDRVSAETFDDLRLMVSELVTNSIRHGGLEPSERIRLTVKLDAPRIRVEVRNPGPGFTPLPEPRPAGGGWGLVIIDRLSRSWGVVEDGLTCVWFELLDE